ncbi:MAG: RNA methyltransferase [Chitinophagaceae bacterium]|nr:RNA methyltransferase [Chitinophagaceae bacterium]
MHNLPTSLLTSLSTAPGFERDAFEQVHESGEQVLSIRFNASKVNHSPTERVSNQDIIPAFDEGFKTPANEAVQLESAVPWATNAFYLNQRPFFTFDPRFHAGAYYVQEASSMFIEQGLKQTTDLGADIKVLDLCAAPGGKSTHLQSLISPNSLLVSNEVIKSRVTVLEENLVKWGGANVVVTNSDPRDLSRLSGLFDVIVIDAPCSGSGLFRRDPEAVAEWNLQNVTLCSQRQQRIIADVWPALNEGGVLIYSTCSYSVEEDEAIADWLISELGADSIKLEISSEWNVIESRSTTHQAHAYRFWPDKVKGEGFFMACFRKTNHQEGGKPVKNNHVEQVTKKQQVILTPWLEDGSGLEFIKVGDSIMAIPASLVSDINRLIASSIYIRQIGIRLGKFAGDQLIPDHALAMSGLLRQSFVAVSLKYQQALQYLRREEVSLDEMRSDEKVQNGWTLVKFENFKLGWIKVLSNRINNYYPREWRILKRSP